MKIRFASEKEQQPTREQGLKVLYAPGKRLAFRVRWYLILLAVVSPLLFLCGRWLLTLLLIEAPAQIVLPVIEIRAQSQGQVKRVAVQVGELVEAGQVVIELDNPEWRERLRLLGSAPVVVADKPRASLAEDGERSVISAQLERAEDRLRQITSLFEQGAATRGELQAAFEARDARLREKFQLELRRVAASPVATDNFERQRELERGWLDSRLAGLDVQATHIGRIQQIHVSEGEGVGPGTLMLSVATEQPAQIWVYLDAKHASQASVGKPLTLIFPDGAKRPAHVIRAVSEAAIAPADLRLPFSAAQRSLRVLVEAQGGIPDAWRIDQLGLIARFPQTLNPFAG